MKKNVPVPLIALTVFMGCKESMNDTGQPNFLFICAEDLSPLLGCYGDTTARTPNLDKLADEGIRFTNAYCNSPICNPSRTSFLTGSRPETHAVVENFYHFRKFIPDSIETMPEFFRNRGYEAVRIGKLFHKPWDTVWSNTIQPHGKSTDESKLNKPEAPVPEYLKGSADEGLYHFMGSSLKWGVSGKDEKGEHDWNTALLACDYLKQQHEQPFFLSVGFFNTHLPFKVPQKYLDMYPIESIPLPDVPENELLDVPNEAYWYFQSIDEIRMTDDEKREAKRCYYAMISFLDDCVGKVVNTLDSAGLKDNTIVIFMSDHGFLLGEHYLWRKEVLFKEALHVPYIMRGAGLPSKVLEEDIFELTDIYPTFAELAGFEVPEHCEGQSFMQHLLNPDLHADFVNWAIVKQGDRLNESIGRSVIKGNWHYIEWDKDPLKSELYHWEIDPDEHENLSHDPNFEEVKEDLQRELMKVELNPKIYELKNTVKNE